MESPPSGSNRPAESPKSHPSIINTRWRIQLSMKTLFFLVTVFGIGSYVATKPGRDAETNESIVNAVHERGGVTRIALYDPSTEEWLQQYNPVAKKYNVVYQINLSGLDLSDEGILRLGIPRAQHLTRLYMNKNNVSDTTIDAISHHDQLHDLRVGATGITDDGIETLTENMQSIFILDIRNTEVTEKGMTLLQQLPKLQYLHVSGENVTTAALEQIAGISTLKVLVVEGVNITDDHIHTLRLMGQLRTLGLYSTSVSEDGINDLERALPHVFIHETEDGDNQEFNSEDLE